MRIYLSSRFGRQGELRQYAHQLAALGHMVTSSWLLETVRDLPEEATPEAAAECALQDLRDLLRSDCLVAFTEGPDPRAGGQRGGRHVEFGIAIALMAPPADHFKHVIVVGHRENVFHALPGVHFFEAWAGCLVELRRAAL